MGNILIVGGGGNLGSVLVKGLSRRNNTVNAIGTGQYDILSDDISMLKNILSALEIDVIVNCAAMIGIANCEEKRLESFRINTEFCAKLSEINLPRKLKIIHFSTDNVFECNNKNEEHFEKSPTRPTTWYGLTKLSGEVALKSNSNAVVVRLPMLISAEINNQSLTINRLITKLMSGETVVAYKNVYNSPIFIQSIVPIIDGLVLNNLSCEKLIHITGSQMLSIYDIVFKIATKMGLNLNKIVGVDLEDADSQIRKPKFGGLSAGSFPEIDFEKQLDFFN